MTFKEKCSIRTGQILSFAENTNVSFIILKGLFEVRRNKPDTLNISPVFFSSVIDNYIQTLMVDIYKMFDNSNKHEKDTESTFFLVKDMRNNLNLLDDIAVSVNQYRYVSHEEGYQKVFSSTKEMLDFYIKAIEDNQEKITSIQKRRSKYYAHWDRSTLNDVKKVFEKHPVCLDDIEELLVLNTNICVALYRYFHQKEIYIPFIHEANDFEKTINCIEAYQKSTDQNDQFVL